MSKTSGRMAAINARAITAMKFACLPAVLLLANCNAPPPPPAAPTVIERTQVVERPGLTVEVPMDVHEHDDDRRRRDDEQRRRDEEQGHRDDHEHDHDPRPH